MSHYKTRVFHNLTLDEMFKDGYFSHKDDDNNQDVFRMDNPDGTFMEFYGEQITDDVILWFKWI
jgi:hypothetical protein